MLLRFLFLVFWVVGLPAVSSGQAVAQNPLAACIDTDGDGWGWDGVASCRVGATPNGECVDTDGDGWGWDGTDSCRITPAQCIDDDGDGWGWNGSKSCRVSQEECTSAKCQLATDNYCIDTDDDGYGWNGTQSCALIYDGSGVCIDSDGDGWGWTGDTSCYINVSEDCIDSDGDGWGWNGYQSCVVDAPEPPPVNSCVINGEVVATMLPQHECDALMDFYFSTDGPNWDNPDNFATATDPYRPIPHAHDLRFRVQSS